MKNPENQGFRYTYSAKEQAELKHLREKYLSNTPSAEADKMAYLRYLDARVTRKGTAVALAVGIVGTLLMGFAMSLIMTDFGTSLGFASDVTFPLGIGLGLIGMAAIPLAYPLYRRIVTAERRKIAPEILRLTEDLMDSTR